MSRDEAIKELTELLPEEFLSEYADAIKMGIEALEQEPCGDCISRKAVDRIINKWLSYPDYELKDEIYDMTKKIHKLPSVTPLPCEDAISRQAALEAFGLSEKSRKYGGDHSGYDTLMKYEIQDILEDLPSVTPQPKEIT